MSGLHLIDISCVRTWPPPLLTRCGCVFVCLKGNFVDEQGNRPELVEILCVRAVGGPPELI